MKILWVVSFPLPAVAYLLNMEKIPFGGWVTTMLSQLKTVDAFELSVAMKAPVEKRKHTKIDGIDYYLLPQSSKDRFDVCQEDVDWVLEDVSPDLLHAEGTETAYAYRMLKTWQGNNIVSMQGILNGYEPYEYGHLPVAEYIATFKGQAALMSVALLANKLLFFKKRVTKEMRSIRLAKNILGRTTWDRAHSYAINPRANYHTCYRVLRDPFYQKQWDIQKIERHTIFVGNAAQPRKGAHIVMRAVAQLVDEYPDIQVFVAGEKPQRTSWREWKKVIGYPAYFRRLIEDLGIEQRVVFLGVLQAEEMAQKMCQAHVCVLSSIIENSPNTLGEAMIMGVPAISSYVGGAPDMATDAKEALFYRDDDPQLLAYRIKQVFDDDALALHLSANASRRAHKTHDRDENLQRMIDIYQTVLRGK
ncbi:Glycosyl transferase, group 1 family protein [hydrothermal vent metagenome]|uniref:Glycosyl transferase, group 1 family protein n=1 Tax=hydrothermal vent metagenome TaxID=652676 RepID=A0A1W1E7K1_9ZZZZ